MKTTHGLVLALVSLILVSIILVSEGSWAGDMVEKLGFFKRNFGTLSWDQLKTTISTPKQASLSVRRHVHYRENVGNRSTTAKTIWERGYGDCYDKALVVLTLCRAIGSEASLVILCPSGEWEAHAIVVGTWKGKMWMSDDGWYETVSSTDDALRKAIKLQAWRGKKILVVDTF